MLYNRDFAMLMRTGRHIPKETLRSEYTAGLVVFWAMAGVLGVIILAMVVK